MPAMPASITGLALSVENRIEPAPRVQFIDHHFVVEPRPTRVAARLIFHSASRQDGQLRLALFDPHDLRGMRSEPSAVGEVMLDLWVATGNASEGALPDRLEEGAWRVMVEVDHIRVPLTYRLEVHVAYDAPPAPVVTPAPVS